MTPSHLAVERHGGALRFAVPTHSARRPAAIWIHYNAMSRVKCQNDASQGPRHSGRKDAQPLRVRTDRTGPCYWSTVHRCIARLPSAAGQLPWCGEGPALAVHVVHSGGCYVAPGERRGPDANAPVGPSGSGASATGVEELRPYVLPEFAGVVMAG